MSAGVDHAESRIHPPILTLLHLLAAFVLNWLLPLPVPGFLRLAGGLLAVGGVVLAVLAVRQLMATHTTVDPHGSVTFVVASGPYGISRNPIYLGFVLFLTGFPLALNTFWGLILGPALVLSFNLLVVQYEEAYLERKFGRVYQDYKLRVRRWV